MIHVVGMYVDQPEVYDEKTVVARRDHVCCECRKPILAGLPYRDLSECPWPELVLELAIRDEDEREALRTTLVDEDE